MILKEDLPESVELEEQQGRYLGVITRVRGDRVTVRCRDFQEREFKCDQLSLEARSEVFPRLQAWVTEELDGESLQVRMLKGRSDQTKVGKFVRLYAAAKRVALPKSPARRHCQVNIIPCHRGDTVT